MSSAERLDRSRCGLGRGLVGDQGTICGALINPSVNQSCIFRVVQVVKSLQDPLEVGNNLLGISDNVRE